MLVLDWVQTLWGCLCPVSTSTLWVLVLTFQPIPACRSSPCHCSCVQITQSQFFRVGSLGDAQDCLPASAVYLVLTIWCQVPKEKF